MRITKSQKPGTVHRKKNEQSFFNGQNTAFFKPTQDSIQTQSFFSHNQNLSFNGNTALSIQPKLKIGKPNDKYEQEADRVADNVVNRIQKSSDEPQKKPRVNPTSGGIQTRIQMTCSDCEKEEKLQKKEASAIEEKNIQKKPIFESNTDPKEEQDIQRKSSGESTNADDGLVQQLNQSKGKGEPLSPDVQGKMESNIGADFNNVRIHTNTKAAQMSQQLNAKAFTHGSDVYFNRGQYDTNSSSGKHLLAHELTHTVQQGASANIRRNTLSKTNHPTIQRNWLGDVWDATGGRAVSGIKSGGKWVGGKVASGAKATWRGAKWVGGKVSSGAKATWRGAKWIGGKAADAFMWIYDKAKTLINKATNWVKNKWNNLKSIASGGFNVIKNLFKAIVGFVKSPFTSISQAIMRMDAFSMKKSWGKFTSFVLKIWDGFHATCMGLLNKVDEIWGTISKYVSGFFGKINGITSHWAFKKLPSSIQRIVRGLINTFKNLWNRIKSGWDFLFRKIKTFVDKALKAVRNFINKVLSFAIDVVVNGILLFGQVLLFIKDFLSDPKKYLQPLAAKMSGYLKGVGVHFKGQINRVFGAVKEDTLTTATLALSPNNSSTMLTTSSTSTGVLQKKEDSTAHLSSASWSEIGVGVWDMMKKKWEEVKKDPLSIVLNILMDLALPIVGNIKDIIRLFKDIGKIVSRPFRASSLQDFWTSLLRILDIPILLYNTFWSIIGRTLALPLLIASFIPHPIVKGIAIAAGYALLAALIVGEGANITQKVLMLKTGRTDDEEKKDIYNSLSDSLIAFAMELALAILIIIISSIANVIKGVFGFIKGKVFKPKLPKSKGKGKGNLDLEDGGKKVKDLDNGSKKKHSKKKKDIELPEDLAVACRIGSINCTKIPDNVKTEVPAYPNPTGHTVPMPGGPYKIRKSVLSGVSRNTKTLQRIVLKNPNSWSSAFKKALNKANGGKKNVNNAIKNKTTTDLKWPVENGEAWQVHHNKPVSFGGDNRIGNLVPLPATVHRLFTTWWTKVQNRFKARFTNTEWKALMTDKTSLSGSKAAAKKPK